MYTEYIIFIYTFILKLLCIYKMIVFSKNFLKLNIHISYYKPRRLRMTIK